MEGESYDYEDHFARYLGVPLFRVVQIRSEIAQVCGGPVCDLDPRHLRARLEDRAARTFAVLPNAPLSVEQRTYQPLTGAD